MQTIEIKDTPKGNAFAEALRLVLNAMQARQTAYVEANCTWSPEEKEAVRLKVEEGRAAMGDK